MIATCERIGRRKRLSRTSAPGSLSGDERGVSAVEFALIMPVFLLALLATVDVGFAVSERMSIDHILRAGAQRAMTDPGRQPVLDVLTTTAANRSSDVEGALALDATRFCACPGNTATAVSCTSVCTGSLPPFAFYRISAAHHYSGIILPKIPLDRAIQVQVR
jgi:Flp pilus assembly protein TadG